MSKDNVAVVTPGAPDGYDPSRHNYIKKQMRLISEGKLVARPGQALHIHIAHDDWCALLTRGGYCDCDPDIRAGS
jgi:hypothetical protein